MSRPGAPARYEVPANFKMVACPGVDALYQNAVYISVRDYMARASTGMEYCIVNWKAISRLLPHSDIPDGCMGVPTHLRRLIRRTIGQPVGIILRDWEPSYTGDRAMVTVYIEPSEYLEARGLGSPELLPSILRQLIGRPVSNGLVMALNYDGIHVVYRIASILCPRRDWARRNRATLDQWDYVGSAWVGADAEIVSYREFHLTSERPKGAPVSVDYTRPSTAWGLFEPREPIHPWKNLNIRLPSGTAEVGHIDNERDREERNEFDVVG